MKKGGFIILFVVFSICLLPSQNSIYLVSTNNAGTSTISVIPNGGGFTLTTTPSSYDVPSKFRFYNVDNVNTYTYNAIRQIKVINTQGVNTATTYFCIGATCLPPSANTLNNPGDYVVLSPGAYDAFIAYFSELPVIGYSEVYYKIFNVNNPNDTLSFTMYYNPSLSSVKEASNVIENFNLFPNPAKSHITISGRINYVVPVSVSIYNILGQKLFQQNYYLDELNFKKNVDISSLSSGIYFLKMDNLVSGQSIVAKKIVVE